MVEPQPTTSNMSTMDINCFLCNVNVVNEVDGNFLSSEEDSKNLYLILCQILNVPQLSNDIKKFENITYCHSCKNIILNMWDLLKNLEDLEKKVIEKKHLICSLLEGNCQNNFNNEFQNSNEEFRSEFVSEVRFNSIKSKLTTAVQNESDRKVCSKTTKRARIMKNITIIKNPENQVEQLEENILKLYIPDELTYPLVSNPVSIDEKPIISEIFSSLETGPEYFENEEDSLDNLINSSFNDSQFQLATPPVYDFHGIELQKFKTELTDVDVRDPFEGIVPEPNFVEQDSETQKTFIGETYAASIDDYSQLDELCLTNTGTKPFRCHLCSKEFKSEKLVNSHSAKKYFKCNCCGQKFSNCNNAEVHERIHVEKKRFKCTHCERTFNFKSNLKTHELWHAKKILKCGYCEKTFLNQSARIIHERIHTDEKPYKCNRCEKTFARQCSLKTHKLEHVLQKPHKCQYCEMTFVKVSLLKAHEFVHTKKTFVQDEHLEERFYSLFKMNTYEPTHTDKNNFKL